MTDQELVELAFTMLERSYVPYSHFPVGAALECADGTVFTGCNVENAAYGSSICAERTALVKAVSEGHRDDFTRIAVVGNSTEPCWPCGACRQMLYEFAPGLTVLVAQRDHSFVKLPLSELLTHGFGTQSSGSSSAAPLDRGRGCAILNIPTVCMQRRGPHGPQQASGGDRGQNSGRVHAPVHRAGLRAHHHPGSLVDRPWACMQGAIYHHFRSKEEIFEAVCQRIGEANLALFTAIRDDPARSGREKLRAMLAAACHNPGDEAMAAMVLETVRDPRFVITQLDEVVLPGGPPLHPAGH